MANYSSQSIVDLDYSFEAPLISEQLNHLDLSKDVLIFYHTDCRNGWACALSAYLFFEDRANYIAIPPTLSEKNFKSDWISGKSVYFFDLCIPEQSLLDKIDSKPCQWTLIDHHPVTSEWSDQFPNNCIYTEKASCIRTYQHFHGEDPPPLLEYISDQNQWNWNLENSKEINTAIDALPKKFESWIPLLDKTQDELKARFRNKGEAIIEYKQAKISRIEKYISTISLYGYKTAVINSSFFQSEIGAFFEQKYDIIFVWQQVSKKLAKASLRSQKVDVNEIAQKLGGGGNSNAAGFTKRLSTMIDIINNGI